MGSYFGEILSMLLRYSECKKRLSASWQSLTIDPPADSCLRYWEYCPSNLSIYYHYYPL